MKKRIMEIFRGASSNDMEVGMGWYEEAHDYTKGLAEKFGLPLDIIAGIISALSPLVEWELNKAQAENLIQLQENAMVSTYKMNKEKALRILNGNSPLKEFVKKTSGFKTYNFYMNILNPDHPLYVTIDRQTLRALGMEYKDIYTRRRYSRAKSQFLYASNQLGVLANKVQAVIWVSYKSQLKNKLNDEVGF